LRRNQPSPARNTPAPDAVLNTANGRCHYQPGTGLEPISVDREPDCFLNLAVLLDWFLGWQIFK
jgi:hypothetical protein